MKLSSDQIERLRQLLNITRDRELNCNECLEHVGEFVEHQLAGEPVPAALEAVEHHLRICEECREEYEALRNALRALHGSGSSDIQ